MLQAPHYLTVATRRLHSKPPPAGSNECNRDLSTVSAMTRGYYCWPSRHFASSDTASQYSACSLASCGLHPSIVPLMLSRAGSDLSANDLCSPEMLRSPFFRYYVLREVCHAKHTVPGRNPLLLPSASLAAIREDRPRFVGGRIQVHRSQFPMPRRASSLSDRAGQKRPMAVER